MPFEDGPSLTSHTTSLPRVRDAQPLVGCLPPRAGCAQLIASSVDMSAHSALAPSKSLSPIASRTAATEASACAPGGTLRTTTRCRLAKYADLQFACNQPRDSAVGRETLHPSCRFAPQMASHDRHDQRRLVLSHYGSQPVCLTNRSNSLELSHPGAPRATFFFCCGWSGVPDCLLGELHPRGDAEVGVDVG
jgi:hypothetical protein